MDLNYGPDQLFDDPYPFYAYLRREKPVHMYEPTGEWFVARWSGCQTIGVNEDVFLPTDSFMPMAKTMGLPNVLTLTGTEHQELREGIDTPLRQNAVDRYVDALARRIVQERIEALRERGRADLTTELFEPISVRCVADVMGLQAISDATLAHWFHALNAGAQNVADDPAVWTMLDGVKAEIEQAVRVIYDRVVASPDDSLISHMTHGGLANGGVRSLEELMPTLRVIILGGLQEPGHGAANAVLGLLQDPEQAAALANDPAGLSLKAYDEGLRWIAPIGVAMRRLTRDFEIDGVLVPAGANVAAILSSANRDERRWDAPEVFQLSRQRKPHSSFGFRPHFCSGHYLSRNIGRIALEESFRCLPNLRLDAEHEVSTKGWRFRGAVKLPAVWDA